MIAVLCLGNALRRDDAVALRVADLLEAAPLPGAVVRRTAVSGLYLLDELEGEGEDRPRRVAAGPHRVDHHRPVEPLELVDQVEPGDRRRAHHRARGGLGAERVRDAQGDRVVLAELVPQAEDEDHAPSGTRRRITSRTSPSGPRSVTTSGSSPGSACDAHALQGS